MSIILDALKKADSAKSKKEPEEKQAEGLSTGMFKPGNVLKASQMISNKKLQVLVLSLVVVLGFTFVSLFIFSSQLKSIFVSASVPDKNLSVQNTQTVNPEIKEKTEQGRQQEKISKLQESARLHFQNGRYEQSVADYKVLTDLLSSNPEVYNNYGVALKKLGKNKEALLAYETALALKPNYPEVLNNVAVIKMAENDYNEARRHLEKAIELEPGYLDPHLHLALCLEKIGDYETAINYYQLFLDKSLGKVEKRLRIQIESRVEHLKEDL